MSYIIYFGQSCIRLYNGSVFKVIGKVIDPPSRVLHVSEGGIRYKLAFGAISYVHPCSLK